MMVSPEKEPGPRKESFLARYPRKQKLGAAAVLLIVAILLGYWSSRPASHPQPGAQISMKDESAAAPTAAAGIPAVAGAPSAFEPSLNEQDDRSIKMAQAPDVGVTEDTPEGSLPRIGEDGRQPWQVYARPFNTADRRPRIAIVLIDLGLSRLATDAAINRMPANVTLAFDAQSPVVGAWFGRARQAGHETLLMVPMEPFDYPRSDPGNNTLLTNLPNADNLSRLNWALRQGTGYVGIVTLSGSRFTTAPDKLATVLDVLKKRGLMILDARVAPHSAILDMARDMHVAAAGVTTRFDQNPSPEGVDAALDQLEKTARLTGHAIGIASPLPIVLDRLQEWVKNLPAEGIALAPVTAMTQ